jgi:Skp family chaperone for outer membrane proteins
VKKYIIIASTVAMLAGCANSSPIGLVDINRIVANWPTFQADQAELQNEERQIANKKESAGAQRKDAIALQNKFGAVTEQLTDQVRKAATTIAQQKNLKLIFTTEGVGYGGVDITSDVEKALNITEKATPSP